MVCHHCTIDGDDAEPWGDTTASTVKPTTQTEEEEAEQQDTELTQSIQQQCPSGEQAAEPSEKRERGKMKKQMWLLIRLHLVKHSSYEKLRS